jgi:putative photosynthetic complex assembly protein 2
MTRDSQSPGAIYASFVAALAVWAWHEVSYLFGYVSGPRPEACPPGLTTLQRFRRGVKTCLYHELAVIATAALLLALTINAANRLALSTFVVLWLMRWSAKLNIFFGVRNLHQEYWPAHLRYLQSYVGVRPWNALFPWSLLAGASAILLLLSGAVQPAGAGRTASLLLVTLLVLALLEHSLMMLRVDDDRLWLPSLRRRGSTAERLKAKV